LSSKNSGGSTARDAVKQHLHSNSGWHEVRDISEAIGYDNDYTRRVAKTLSENHSNIYGRKNANKLVIGYEINGEIVVPGSDETVLISLIQRHSSNPPANIRSLSVSELQRYLRNKIANGGIPLENKLEFRWK
jgi:hypothetical protein